MSNFLPGTEVLARGLRWEVVRDQPSDAAVLYRLRCLEGALQGQEVDLVWPFERVEPIAAPLDPRRAGHLDVFRVYHEAFLLEQSRGSRALLAAQPGRLRIEPYQLVPVTRALAMARPRLLIADDVGLGKTVEAGLVLAELIARRRAHRILIVSPAGPLLVQWQREMRERFGLRFTTLDAATLQQIRYEHELGSNPFDHVALGIASLDFAKQEKVLADIERSHFDVVVIDEAHHVAGLGAAGDREDSQRRKLATVLAQKSDALLLLTATPHDGHDAHFASLIELLDPSLIAKDGDLHEGRYLPHVVRRLKRHIKDVATGEDLFREREVVPERVTAGGKPAFAAFQRELARVLLPALRRALDRRAFAEALGFLALLKRAVSTVAAAHSTLTHVRDRYEDLVKKGGEEQEARRQRIRSLRAMLERSARFGALSFEEEQDRAQLEAEDIASELYDEDTTPEERLREEETTQRSEAQHLRRRKDTHAALDRLRELAAKAEPEDPKLAAVVAAVRAVRAEEPLANVLVYTEYTDSQKAVIDALTAAVLRGEIDGEVKSIAGEDPEKAREEVTEAFKKRDGIVLVSTDASAEGLNLHTRCHHLIHVELPYNPNRLEQRNGRIDRFGQTRTPFVRYMYLAGSFEERLLFKLVDKYETQKKRLGFMPNTLGVTAADIAGGTLLRSLVDDAGPLFAEGTLVAATPVDDTSSPAFQVILDEMERAQAGVERATRAQAWLAEQGAAADRRTAEAAAEAQVLGLAMGAVSLADFVRDAVRAESRDARPAVEEPDGTLAFKLPPSFCVGLEELPGFDRETSTLRVSRTIERDRDAEGRPLAYLGRAHPVVRRALDRVRNVQLGGGGQLDRRVAAARGDGPEPALLYTFVGQVQSRAGRELSVVVAVRLDRGGSLATLVEPRAWQPWLAPERAVAPARVWEAHFASWARADDPRAREAALGAFTEIAAGFTAEHEAALDADRRDVEGRLRMRAEQIAGKVVRRQLGLFDAVPGAGGPEWSTIEDPMIRLAAFSKDVAVPSAKRNEASAVVDIFQDRLRRIEQRAALDAPRLHPLGLLLLVPG